MNKKQTAVEWMIEQLEGQDSKIARVIGLEKYNEIIGQAKAMERRQIVDSYEACPTNEYGEFLTGEQYFTETYGENIKTSTNE